MPNIKKQAISEILKKSKNLYHGGSWSGQEPFKGNAWLTEHLDDAKMYAEPLGSDVQRVELLNIQNPYILKPKKEEANTVLQKLDKTKYDALYDPEVGDWVVWDPSKIMHRGIAKAKGGAVNPLKSPREILFEMAGIPSFSKGQSVGKFGTEMYRLITNAIEQYTKKFGRPPSPEDVQALKRHAQEISKKAEIKTDPTTQARARHQMATDPNLINPEGPDPFLTKATTGRTVKGTYIQPKAQDINDPNVQANIEMKQAAGELEDIMPESITPSADYMARTSSAMENKALAAGKTPLIDMLKAAFFKKNGRYPTDEELDIIVAEYNPMRHQYGERGASVVTERPPTARGMSDWRQQARAEGIPEAYLNKPPADYPKYLLDELAISRGQQPGTRPMPETRINPDRSYAGGGSTSPTRRQMLAEMVAKNFRPQAMADGGRPRRGYQQSMDAVKDFFRGVRDAPREVIGTYADMLGIRPAPTRAPLEVSEMSAPQGRLIPFEGQGSGAYEAGKFTSGMIGDPINALYAAPVLQGARRAIAAPVRAAARNPIKTSVMLGAVPATTISAENE